MRIIYVNCGWNMSEIWSSQCAINLNSWKSNLKKIQAWTGFEPTLIKFHLCFIRSSHIWFSYMILIYSYLYISLSSGKLGSETTRLTARDSTWVLNILWRHFYGKWEYIPWKKEVNLLIVRRSWHGEYHIFHKKDNSCATRTSSQGECVSNAFCTGKTKHITPSKLNLHEDQV